MTHIKVYNGEMFLGYASEMKVEENVDDGAGFNDIGKLMNKTYTVTFNIDVGQFVNNLSTLGFQVAELTSLMPGVMMAFENFDGGKPGILNNYKQMLNQMAICPVCHDNDTLEMIVMDLNDIHKWTREDIADWMDGLVAEGKLNIDIESKDKDKA